MDSRPAHQWSVKCTNNFSNLSFGHQEKLSLQISFSLWQHSVSEGTGLHKDGGPNWRAACLIFLTGCCARLLSSSLDLLLMTVAAITVRNNTRRFEQTQLNGSISLHVAIQPGPTFSLF